MAIVTTLQEQCTRNSDTFPRQNYRIEAIKIELLDKNKDKQ